MLMLRSNQVEAFRNAALDRYVGRTIEHFQEYFPKYCQVVGVEALDRLIRMGITRAEPYGIVSERDVCLYVTIMITLGAEFDVDPQYPWAVAILHDQTIDDPSERADQLFDTATRKHKEFAGEENQHLQRAIARLRSFSNDDQLTPSTGTTVADVIVDIWRSLYPTKCAAVGDSALRSLCDAAQRRAARYNLHQPRSISIYVTVAFFLGIGFDVDPQFPWVSAAMNDAGQPSEQTRAYALRSAAIDFANRLFTKPGPQQ